MAQSFLRSLLALSETRDFDLDDPRLTDLRRSIVQNKPFLNAIYREWYSMLLQPIQPGSGPILELGSGAGFMAELCGDVTPSEIFWCRNTRVVLDGCALPYPDASLRAIVMTDVLHHIPAVRRFFDEANRCLNMGGVIAMIEPWSTAWSRFIYRHLHHEPFDTGTTAWDFPSTGPLSGANGALPWILFHRDRAVFEHEYPQLRIEQVKVFMPFRYLVSGGVSMKSLSPRWSYGLWKTVEYFCSPLMNHLGMFALIVLRKVDLDHDQAVIPSV